jgi:hypothetical protein
MGSDEARRHRRRRRAVAPAAEQPPPEPAEQTASAPVRKRANRDSGERGLRDLVGAGRSQLGVSGALRGRDVDRPTEADLAEADRDVVIVRRHWKPRD